MDNALRPRDQLQREYGLRVLQLLMDSADGDDMIIFTLSSGNGEEIARLTTSIDDVGLLPIHDLALQGENGLEEKRFHLPERILITLRNLLGESGQLGDPLWLRLSVPRGFLTTVPWEYLLQPELGVPILRLPQHLICPHAPSAGLDFILCLSSTTIPVQAQATMVRDVIRNIPAALAGKISFHVFIDSAVHPYLQELTVPVAPGCRVNIHVPPKTLAEVEPSITRPCENWWLLWMKSVLGATTADDIHFLCDGYRIRDEGALVLPQPETTMEVGSTERLVFATELLEFLEDVGAWSLTITSTPRNRSAAGLRMLHDRVAQQRPGPTVLHDMEYPEGLQALSCAYEFLYLPPQQPPASPMLSIYCHPLWTTGVGGDAESQRQLQQYTLDGRLSAQIDISPPAWLASAQRRLEATAGELAAAESVNPDTGRKRAREFVVDAIAKHAQRVSGSTEGDKK